MIASTRRLPRHRRTMRLARVGAVLWLACAAGGVAESTAVYPIFGRIWTEAELRAAYGKIRELYAVDDRSRAIRPSGELGAFPVSGTVVDTATGPRLILETRAGLVAVRCAATPRHTRGAELSFVVRESGSTTLSYVPAGDTRIDIPDYKDHTLTFADFVTSLQRGFHYPELPELGTKAHRIGKFRTKRPDRNVIVDP